MPLAASFEERSELPKLTAEVFVIPTEEKRFIVYAPLCRIAFIANASVVNALAKIERGDFSATTFSDKDLLRLFRDLEIVDGVAERLPLVDLSDALEPTSVTLFLTTACNLRCRYCYASAGEAPVHAMPPAVARQGIDFVLRNAVKRGHSQIEIAFHGGGEPTMNWTTLTAAMDYAKAAARRSGVQVVGGIASNGVLSQARAAGSSTTCRAQPSLSTVPPRSTTATVRRRRERGRARRPFGPCGGSTTTGSIQPEGDRHGGCDRALAGTRSSSFARAFALARCRSSLPTISAVGATRRRPRPRRSSRRIGRRICVRAASVAPFPSRRPGSAV